MGIHSTLALEPAADGTRLPRISDLRPHGLLTTVTPLLAVLGRRQTRRNL